MPSNSGWTLKVVAGLQEDRDLLNPANKISSFIFVTYGILLILYDVTAMVFIENFSLLNTKETIRIKKAL